MTDRLSADRPTSAPPTAAEAAGAPPAPDAPDPAAEALAEWVGWALMADPDGVPWRDAAFVDWLGAEARAADRAARRESDAAFLARGRALMARAQARRLGVLRFPAAEPWAPPAGRRVREGVAVPGRRLAPVVELGVAAGPGRDLWDEPTERWLRVPEVAPDARYLAVRIVGTSMTPLLANGSVVLVRADARGREARAGRVVVARHPDDGYVCKRVAAVGAGGLVLASLEPGHAELRLPPDPGLVVGTVVGVWPNA
jgi:SOS-response transcriptional repressor LexA